MLNKAP
ncbi:a79dcd9c-5ba7-4196-8748-05f83b7c3bd3 [Thermothielavioides terrestris]|nr:a79dcd9c-5ba7-4196-8748-05f83b7c3bd3 [Thermothielavioides terrestris]